MAMVFIWTRLPNVNDVRVSAQCAVNKAGAKIVIRAMAPSRRELIFSEQGYSALALRSRPLLPRACDYSPLRSRNPNIIRSPLPAKFGFRREEQ